MYGAPPHCHAAVTSHTMLMTFTAHLRTHISRGRFADLSLHPPCQVAAAGVCHDEVERVGRLKRAGEGDDERVGHDREDLALLEDSRQLGRGEHACA